MDPRKKNLTHAKIFDPRNPRTHANHAPTLPRNPRGLADSLLLDVLLKNVPSVNIAILRGIKMKKARVKLGDLTLHTSRHSSMQIAGPW